MTAHKQTEENLPGLWDGTFRECPSCPVCALKTKLVETDIHEDVFETGG